MANTEPRVGDWPPTPTMDTSVRKLWGPYCSCAGFVLASLCNLSRVRQLYWCRAGEHSCCGEYSHRCRSIETLPLLVPIHSCWMYQMSPRLLGLQSDEDLSMRVTTTLWGLAGAALLGHLCICFCSSVSLV